MADGQSFEDRVNARIKQCVELGLEYKFSEDAYLDKDNRIYIPILDIKTYSDEKWDSMVERFKNL